MQTTIIAFKTTYTDTLTNTKMIDPIEDETWDAQDMGCGELLLALRKRLRSMPGKTIKIIARDLGAQEDLPAFCRITHHELLCAKPPVYWIKARTD